MACLVEKIAEGFDGLPGRLLSLRPLQYVGTISYGIYLYHLFVLKAFWKLLGVARQPLFDKGFVLFLIVASMTVAMAALSWKFLEQPFKCLKRHFPYEPEASGGQQEVLTQSS
ncbi:MAG TPA: acyltransferase family protein [Chthoniobacterales bacterium]|nr:acyltransferase family protein [Chthoniobacterales bacterium]